MKPGDLIEATVKPLAKALNLSCLDDQGNLKPKSPCAKSRDTLNWLGDAAYDFLWPQPKEK